MDWIQTFTVMSVLGGIMFYLMGRVDGALNRMDQDLKSLHNDMTAANQRIDTLYQMFVDLLKEGRR
jgi:hypothetical protein